MIRPLLERKRTTNYVGFNNSGVNMKPLVQRMSHFRTPNQAHGSASERLPASPLEHRPIGRLCFKKGRALHLCLVRRCYLA